MCVYIYIYIYIYNNYTELHEQRFGRLKIDFSSTMGVFGMDVILVYTHAHQCKCVCLFVCLYIYTYIYIYHDHADSYQ